MNGCPVIDLGLVRDVLTAVDCNTRGFARLGYESLTASGSAFQIALTLALTIYVAVLGYRLLFARGGASLSDGAGIALKIGAILALLSSWSVFQTLVFDIAARAPVDIAGAVSAPLRGTGSLAADPVAGLQVAYDRLTGAAADFAKPVKLAAAAQAANNATAAETLSAAANALFVASVGLIAVLTVAIGVLTATGPIFIALFLFFETRGFFVGWVRALASAAFGLLSAWTLAILMLHALEPWLRALAEGNATGMPDVQVAITTSVIVFVFAASQAGLLMAGMVIACGFHLRRRQASVSPPNRTVEASAESLNLISRPARLAQQLQRLGDSAAWTQGPIFATATGRAGQAAAAGAAVSPQYPGDLYRRPSVSRSEPARERG